MLKNCKRWIAIGWFVALMAAAGFGQAHAANHGPTGASSWGCAINSVTCD